MIKKIVICLLCVIAPLIGMAQDAMVRFDFVEAPLALAVESLAQQAGKIVKVDSSVKATITLSSKPVTWTQALNLIKSQFKLRERIEGKTLWLEPIRPKQVSKPKKEKNLLPKKQTPSSIPVKYFLRLYRLEYYPAHKIEKILTNNKNNLFGELVSAQAEADQNIVMVRASEDSHKQIRDLIQTLDKPLPRITISSRIVIAKDQASNELGVRLGTRAIDGNWGIAGGINGVFSPNQNGINSSINDNLIFDLGLDRTPAGRATLGFNDGTSIIELELQTLAASGNIDIIASPQVTVRSGSKAIIATGTEVPYSQVVDDNVDIFFKEALLKLEVTASVIGEQQILMDIVIRLDNLGQQYNGVPSIDTNKLDTQVTLKPNETLILGGIFRTLDTDEIEKVPILGDIPIIGWLFKHTKVNKEKAELLVFITPNFVSN